MGNKIHSHFSIHKEVLKIIKIRSTKEIYKASHLPIEVQDEIIRVDAEKD